MLVSLVTGKVVQMSVEQYLLMEDEDYQYLIALDWGDDIFDPFHNCSLRSICKEKPEEITLPLTEIEELRKEFDLDFEPDIE
jgi:hypothetical protein